MVYVTCKQKTAKLKGTPKTEAKCPLCKADGCDPFFSDATRSYIRCNVCELVFVPEEYWLSSKEEKEIYDLHENDMDDPGYRKFLSRLSTPLLERLNPNCHGLDFGCGPGPALARVFEEHGHSVELYDPFYFNNPSALNREYDFLCATEVVEHLRDPQQVFTTLFSLLIRGGWLAIMTKMVSDSSVSDRNTFANWHYIRDMTHICFYHRNTFLYLAQRFNATFMFIGQDVILFQKPK